MNDKKISNFVKALDKHLSTGAKDLDNEAYKNRLSVCESCSNRSADWICNLCGCHLTIKALWADSECDADKWPKIPLPMTTGSSKQGKCCGQS